MKRIEHLVKFLLNLHDEVRVYDKVIDSNYAAPLVVANWDAIDRLLHDKDAERYCERGSQRMIDALENAGYSTGWGDEWVEVEGFAVRGAGLSPGERAEFVWLDDEPVLCDSIRTNWGTAMVYIGTLINDHERADIVGMDVFLHQIGFVKQEHEYAGGLDGSDNPEDALKVLGGGKTHDVVFQIVWSGDQFRTYWRAWTRPIGCEVPERTKVKAHFITLFLASPPKTVMVITNGELETDDRYVGHVMIDGNLLDIVSVNGGTLTGLKQCGSNSVFLRVEPSDIGTMMPFVRAGNDAGYRVVPQSWLQ